MAIIIISRQSVDCWEQLPPTNMSQIWFARLVECVSFPMRVILVFQGFPQSPIWLRVDPIWTRGKKGREIHAPRETRDSRGFSHDAWIQLARLSLAEIWERLLRCPKPNINFDFSLFIDFINFQGLCQELINGHILSSHRSENRPKLMAINERTSVHRMVIMNQKCKRTQDLRRPVHLLGSSSDKTVTNLQIWQ